MRKSLFGFKRFWLLLALLLGIIFLLSLRPVQILLQTAPDIPRALPAEPALKHNNRSDWNKDKWRFGEAMQAELYGQFPSSLSIKIDTVTKLEKPAEISAAEIEVWSLMVTTKSDPNGRHLDFVLLKPEKPNDLETVILAQTFCPIHNVVPLSGVPAPQNITFSCDGNSFFSSIMHYFFGRYIVSPPLNEILNAGYAIGVLFPPQYIADSPEAAQRDLDSLFSDLSADERPGTLMVWAALSAELAGSLQNDFDSIVAWGHSRYGKTAILAALSSRDIDGVIAHQSGTAGASLSRNKPGETLADLIAQYPHWLGLNARKYSDNPAVLSFDQHHLIAALAPRPILLGNARRDVWSDPEGAFRAALAANKIYDLYVSEGMTADRLDEFRPADDISFWIRPGTHGIVEEDWPAFLAFLKAHFP